MRILVAIQELRFGGAERLLVTLRDRALAAGHEVTVAAAPGPLAEEAGLERFSLPLVERRAWRVPHAVWEFRRAVRAVRPDVVHCHNPGMALVASIATGRGRRPPGLVTVHGVPNEDYTQAARVLRLAGLHNVACGPGVAISLEEAGLRVQSTIVNGVGPAPLPLDRATLAAKWGLEAEQPLVVAIGRLVEQKNHALAIHALAAVPDAVLVIIGEGPLQRALVEEAELHGVRDRVVFAGPRPDARAVAGAADALVHPSHWEGLPLVVLEALAGGTPVAATAVRGVRELLTHERNALLVPPGDAGALAEAVRRLLSNSSLQERLTREGQALASTYSEERMASTYLRLYEELAT